jgi:hypothetical protein
MKEKTNSAVNFDLKYMFNKTIKFIKSPLTAKKENLEKYDDIKEAGIYAVFVSLLVVIANLVTTMLNTIVTRTYTGSIELSFDGLGDLKYLDLIFVNFLWYIGVIVVIALVYFIVMKIKDMKANYGRLLYITTGSIISYYLAITLVAPIITLISPKLYLINIIVSLSALMYGMIVFYELVNEELKLTGDKKIFFNMVCTIILVIILVVGIRIYLNDTYLAIDGLNNITKSMNNRWKW